MKTNKKTLRKPKPIRKEEHCDYRMHYEEDSYVRIKVVSRIIKVINWQGKVVYSYSAGEPTQEDY